MKKIIVVTGTRAEYGLLKPLIEKISVKENIDLKVAVTGMHMSPEFGLTYKEIEKDGIQIDEKIEILLSSDTDVGVVKSMGLAMISFAEYFNRTAPDFVIVLGDRFEIMAVACAAYNLKIPVAHLCGGEITQGALDDGFRHSVTKMSHLHFTTTKEHRQRVIQLGENPEYVYNFGSISTEYIQNMKKLSIEELSDKLNLDLNLKYCVVTFHPVTTEEETARKQMKELLDALVSRQDLQFVITKANADAGGRQINQMIDEYANRYSNIKAYTSLGRFLYLNTVRKSEMVIGNSSSGIIEAPSFHIPTINIGNRQEGRTQGETIINCEPEQMQILNAMEKGMNKEYLKNIQNSVNPYEADQTSTNILKTIEKYLDKGIEIKKTFYDI